MSDGGSQLSLQMANAIDQQLAVDKWLKGKWDTEKIMETKGQLMDSLLKTFVAPQEIEQAVANTTTISTELVQKEAEPAQSLA